MEKETKKVFVGDKLLYMTWDDDENNLDELIEKLLLAKSKGATKVLFELDFQQDIEIMTYYDQLESDQEFEIRKARKEAELKQIQHYQDRVEKETYERLKLKFEK